MVLERYRAAADYKKRNKNELNFKEGDIFEVVEKNDNGVCVRALCLCVAGRIFLWWRCVMLCLSMLNCFIHLLILAIFVEF